MKMEKSNPLTMNYVSVIGIIYALLVSAVAKGEQTYVVSELRITTLSTMLTEFRGVGEWGFAALVEADGHTVLFDTGARPNTVLANAEELGIDLSAVDTVILSHNHWDHAGGLVTLRRTLKAKKATSVKHTHVGEGIFLPRRLDADALSALPPISKELLVNIMDVRDDYEALGGTVVVHDKPHELHPGMWVTGPIPRVHPEKNWTPFMRIQTEDSLVEDTIPEDQALVINTTKGLVVIAGCGHAGIVNTMEYARSIINATQIHAVLGGFHLMSLTDEKIEWTGHKMREFGVNYVVGAHCTGINAVTGLRKAGNLSRETAVVGTVGSTFTLGKGIQPGLLNQ
jgi:7,8-dihydropterin-6-yl-methyl-4-(beta-D-ribofuranosyl)aminobenzene 5'-phosphate synthase